LRYNTKQNPIKQEPELIELTDSEDEGDKTNATANNLLNRSENENEIKAGNRHYEVTFIDLVSKN